MEKNISLIIICSPTFSLQSISTEIEDGRGIVIISEFRKCVIDELKEYQIENAEKNESALLIFDDIGSLGKQGKLSIQMADLAYIVRHLRVSIIELAQRVTLLSTGLSSQADLWIFFCEQNPNERINIFRRIGFGDKDSFWEKFDQETREIRTWVGVRKVAGRNFFFNQNGFI